MMRTSGSILASCRNICPARMPENTNYAMGYFNANLIVRVLSACGDDLGRESVLRHATSLDMVRLPLLLPA